MAGSWGRSCRRGIHRKRVARDTTTFSVASRHDRQSHHVEMSDLTRSEFLGFSAALAGAAVGCGGFNDSAAQAPSTRLEDKPDLAVVNARVYTIDDAQPRAEAFAIKDGRFAAV